MEYPAIEEQFRKLLPQGNVLVVAASEATRTSLANLGIRIMEERGARLILVETPENASLAPEHTQHLRLSHELVEDCYYLSNDILRGNKAFDPIVVHPFLGESTLQLIDAIVGRRTGGQCGDD